MGERLIVWAKRERRRQTARQPLRRGLIPFERRLYRLFDPVRARDDHGIGLRHPFCRARLIRDPCLPCLLPAIKCVPVEKPIARGPINDLTGEFMYTPNYFNMGGEWSAQRGLENSINRSAANIPNTIQRAGGANG